MSARASAPIVAKLPAADWANVREARLACRAFPVWDRRADAPGSTVARKERVWACPAKAHAMGSRVAGKAVSDKSPACRAGSRPVVDKVAASTAWGSKADNKGVVSKAVANMARNRLAASSASARKAARDRVRAVASKAAVSPADSTEANTVAAANKVVARARVGNTVAGRLVVIKVAANLPAGSTAGNQEANRGAANTAVKPVARVVADKRAVVNPVVGKAPAVSKVVASKVVAARVVVKLPVVRKARNKAVGSPQGARKVATSLARKNR